MAVRVSRREGRWNEKAGRRGIASQSARMLAGEGAGARQGSGSIRIMCSSTLPRGCDSGS
jgi:hypothetical protein